MISFVSPDLLFDRVDAYGAVSKPCLFLIDYEMRHGVFVDNPFEASEVFWEASGVGNAALCGNDYKRGTYFSPVKIGSDEYGGKFDVISDALRRGDTFLANLTVATPVDTDYSLEEIFCRSMSRYRLLVPGLFVCFSPETFVRIDADGVIRSFPMKGTISGTIPDAERIILNDYKETCEHNTIVDFIRSDLARVGRNVRVERFRYIDRLDTSHGEVLQVSSEVAADLPCRWRSSLGKIVRELLPAGSICGAPRVATLDAIARAEGEPRGFYTGIMGYFDGSRFDSAVLIRYLETPALAKAMGWKSDDVRLLKFRSGGGITINSRCADEYDEVLEKVYLPF